MKWLFGLISPYWCGKKGSKAFFICPNNNWSYRTRFNSLSTVGVCAHSHSVASDDAHFHSAPSPMTHIFIPRLLLWRTFSFRAFSHDAHFHSAPSPMTHIFIPRLLLWRTFSFHLISFYASTQMCLILIPCLLLFHQIWDYVVAQNFLLSPTELNFIRLLLLRHLLLLCAFSYDAYFYSRHFTTVPNEIRRMERKCHFEEILWDRKS